jgi:hypothetical protein
MEYSFDIKVAEKYGVDEAIMIKNFQFWIKKNKASKKHSYDGRTWTYNSAEEYTIFFPFWSSKQIRRILSSLISQGVIITGNYNKVRYDQTLWYAFDDESEFLSGISPKRFVHGHVYVIEEKGLYKIGCSSDYEKRLKKFKTAKLIATYETDNIFADERKIHLLFDEKRVCGEWFGLNANDLMVISNFPFEKMEVTEQENQIDHKGKPIPDNKPDILTDNKTNDVPAPLNAEAVRLTQLFYDEIVRNRNPKVWLKNPPDLKKWQPHIEKMHTIDGLSYSDIEKVIRWVVAESFWSKYILSAETLRRQTRDKDFLGRASPAVTVRPDADEAKKRLEELNARYG